MKVTDHKRKDPQRKDQGTPNCSPGRLTNFQAPLIHIKSQSIFQHLTLKYELIITKDHYTFFFKKITNKKVRKQTKQL